MSSGAWIEWDNSTLYAALQSPNGMVMAELAKAGNRVVNRAVDNVNDKMLRVRTGNLKGSINARAGSLDGEPAVIVGSFVEYAPYTHEHRPWLLSALEYVGDSL